MPLEEFKNVSVGAAFHYKTTALNDTTDAIPLI